MGCFLLPWLENDATEWPFHLQPLSRGCHSSIGILKVPEVSRSIQYQWEAVQCETLSKAPPTINSNRLVGPCARHTPLPSSVIAWTLACPLLAAS